MVRTKTENNKRTIRRMGISWHMILEHKVSPIIISLEHEGSDRIVSQGWIETEQGKEIGKEIRSRKGIGIRSKKYRRYRKWIGGEGRNGT